VLRVENLVVKYGGITATDSISFHVDKGETVALIGANGAGKSSTMHAISALLKVASGHIYFEEQEITKLSADQIVKLGVIQVPEGRQIFTKLSVEENLRMGAYTKKNKEEIKRNHELVMDLFPILRQRRTQSAGTLSGGEQQMLAISRAMMASPRMLLLDEPSMGLSPILTQQVFGVLKELGKNGITIFIIEQNAYDALEISDRSYIMESGRITLEGVSSDLIEDKRVKDAYLGGNV
jgi:branched-chain amino acid transport system ATP-binding protein